jgi:large subunit ribosomal protein L29
MKNKEVSKLTKDELNNKINTLKKDLFNFRFRKINGQMEDTSKVSQIKREVAKMITNLNKKK